MLSNAIVLYTEKMVEENSTVNWKKEVTKADSGRRRYGTQISIPQNAGKSDPALSRGRISNWRDEAFLSTRIEATVHVAGDYEEDVEGLSAET